MRLPKLLPAMPRQRGRHRLDEMPGGYRPEMQSGGVLRGANQPARAEQTYRGVHRGPERGAHSRPRPLPPPADPFIPPAVAAPKPRSRPVMGQPPRGGSGGPLRPGSARARFGNPTRITDMAPAYRASGVRAQTRQEAAAAELSARAFEAGWRARAQATRDRTIARADHDPPPPPRPPARTGTVSRSSGGRASSATAGRPPAPLPRVKATPGRHRPPVPPPVIAGAARSSPWPPGGWQPGDTLPGRRPGAARRAEPWSRQGGTTRHNDAT